jgi:polyisoprenoid-binding protein YceI
MKTVILTVFVLLFSITGIDAQGILWEIDKAHSGISFSISHLVINDVTGKFNEFDGKIITPSALSNDFSDTKVEIVIKANSINTDNIKRDEHLRGADFFDVAKYEDITFKSTSFVKTGENDYKITGELNMHGIIKAVVFEAKLKGVIKDPWGNTRAGFKVKTTIARYDFDIVYNSTLETGGFLIGKTVDVEANIEIVKKTN